MVEYISYKGEKYPIRIAWSTMKKLNPELDKIEVFELALWYGLISGHVAENKELKLKREDVEYILDESLDEFKDIYEKMLSKFSDSEGEDKKK